MGNRRRRQADGSPGVGCPDCGKRRFDSRAQAKRFAQMLEGSRGGGKYRAYACGDFWHLASWDHADRVAYYRERV